MFDLPVITFPVLTGNVCTTKTHWAGDKYMVPYMKKFKKTKAGCISCTKLMILIFLNVLSAGHKRKITLLLKSWSSYLG